jgi:hypothetical protein
MVRASRRIFIGNTLFSAVVLACGAIAPVPAFAAQFTRVLDVSQGFNPKKDKQTPVGYITSLKIGGVGCED